MGYDGLGLGLAASTLFYGLRHGIDWDHIAAITDVTAAQETPRRAMRVASAYAVGHGVVVLGLGLVAIIAGDLLPAWLDALMGRVVGLTLIALAVYVGWSLARHGRRFRLRSRWMLVAAGMTRARRWARNRVVVIKHDHPHAHGSSGGHEHGHDHPHSHDGPSEPGDSTVLVGHRHEHRHVGEVPDDPFAATTTRAAVVLGAVHGVGAETPTQVLLFLTARNVAGSFGGVVLLSLFIVGLVVSNTAVAAASSYGYLNANRSFRVYAGVALANAAFSLVIGAVFLSGGTLPAILGG